jgi:HlyD family secretion protein
LAGLAIGCGGGDGASQAQDKPVERDSLVAMARLEPRDPVLKIGAPDGIVARLLVQEGQRVKRGQPLAYLDTYEARVAERDQALLKRERAKGAGQDLAARSAAVEAAEAEARFREIARQRYKGMFEQGLISEGDYRETETSAARAAADLAREKAALEQAKETARLLPQEAEAEVRRADALAEQALVRAPQDGVVLRVIARAGERSGPQGVLQMGETAEMFAVAEVHANDVGRVAPGAQAVFTSPALKAPLSGRVASVGALIFKNDVFGENANAPENQRVVQVRIRLDKDEAAARLTNLEGQARISLGR